MDIHILQTSDIESKLDKDKSLITFNHSFELSNGQKINTILTYNSKEIKDVEAFKTTLFPEIKKAVQVAISYGLGDKADQVVLESGKLARFKENKQVSFKNEAKDLIDYKTYKSLDTLLELKTQKLAKSSDENKKARIDLINKIAHVLTSGASVDQKNADKPKPTTNKPKPSIQLKSALKSKPSVQKKRVRFDESLRFQGVINTIHRHLKKIDGQSKDMNWKNFDELQRMFLEIVRQVESTEIKGDYKYTWASSKERINHLIQSIEAKRPIKA